MSTGPTGPGFTDPNAVSSYYGTALTYLSQDGDHSMQLNPIDSLLPGIVISSNLNTTPIHARVTPLGILISGISSTHFLVFEEIFNTIQNLNSSSYATFTNSVGFTGLPCQIADMQGGVYITSGNTGTVAYYGAQTPSNAFPLPIPTYNVSVNSITGEIGLTGTVVSIPCPIKTSQYQTSLTSISNQITIDLQNYSLGMNSFLLLLVENLTTIQFSNIVPNASFTLIITTGVAGPFNVSKNLSAGGITILNNLVSPGPTSFAANSTWIVQGFIISSTVVSLLFNEIS
jgi:hypothetical protein